MASDGRGGATRRIGWARLVARARQVLTTDPTPDDGDDAIVDEAGAAALAREAGAHKGGLAKLAQLSAYQAGEPATLPGPGRAALARLWDQAPPLDAGTIAGVVETDLGRAPGALFARWSATPIAAASLGQVHAAEDPDGARWAVKVQYPTVAEGLRADLASGNLARQLAGAAVGAHLDAPAIAAIREGLARELDYRHEADGLVRFAAAWADDPIVRVPAVDRARSSARVLTMALAPGVPLSTWRGDVPSTAQVAEALLRFAWGSPLAHGCVHIDPHPGNFFVEDTAQGPRLWCLDFGGWIELPKEIAAADRVLWSALVDDDPFAAAERFRMGLAAAGLLARTDRLASAAHREWERLLALPLAPGGMTWTPAYADALADQFARVLAAGSLTLPAPVAMLWRQRLGTAAVLGRLGAHVDGRTQLRTLLGGRRALR